MRFEFVYLALSFVIGAVYYLIQKKFMFGKLVHSEVLLKGMNVDLVFSVMFTVICLLILLTINGVKDGMEIRYSVELFGFLLRTSSVKIKSMFWMNVTAYILQLFTLIVGIKISFKSKEHKNLLLEKKLVSDRVVCYACSILSTLEIAFCLLINF